MADIIALAKSILELSSGINNANLAKQVSELTIAIAQAENEMARLIRENSELKEKNRVLCEDREKPLIFNEKNKLYYQSDDTGHESPFCPHCYEAGHLRIHLTEKTTCPHCDKDFTPPLSFKEALALL
jgi:hypothetical protein